MNCFCAARQPLSRLFSCLRGIQPMVSHWCLMRLRAVALAAKILMIAIDNKEAATELARHMHEHHPHVHVIARAIDRWHVYELWSAGCRDIIRETYDSSIRMGRSAFEALGIESHHARAMAAAFDETDRRSMVEVADVYDPAIPVAENEAYVAKVRKILDEWGPEMQKRMQEIRRSDLNDHHSPG